MIGQRLGELGQRARAGAFLYRPRFGNGPPKLPAPEQIGQEAVKEPIAGQHLISALAVEQHRDAALVDALHHTPLRKDARGKERLVLLPDQALHIGAQALGGGEDQVLLSAGGGSDLVHVGALIIRPFALIDGAKGPLLLADLRAGKPLGRSSCG